MTAKGRSERDKMRAGETYNHDDPELVALRGTAQRFLAEFNTRADTAERRGMILNRLLGTANGVVIVPPLLVDYGLNIHFDEACFVNEGCHIEDACEVRIGAFTQISSGVRILTANPVPDAGPGFMARPVVIGRNVWIGAGAVLYPGVRLGDDAIIGAGAVVTLDVPEGATVAGNPARRVG